MNRRGLSNKILAGELADGDAILVDYKGKSFTFEKAASPSSAKPRN